MDVSAPPSLDSACPQANTELSKHDHRFKERGVDNKEYGHGSIMFINIIMTATIIHKTSHDQVIIYPQVKV